MNRFLMDSGLTQKLCSRLTPLLLLISLLAVVSGCGGTVAAPSSNSAASGAELSDDAVAAADSQPHKLSIMLDWYPNAVHSFLYAALENGYFAGEGLNVEILMPADSNDALKLVAAGKIDLALSYQPQILLAREQQLPVKSIAALVRHPLNHLLVPADSGIASPKDLSGLTAGYSSIPLYEAMLRTMVQHDGGDPDDVTLVDVGFDLIPAITTGRVNGIIGGFINHEQLILEKENHAMLSIDPAQYGVPDYYELVLVAGEQALQDSRGDFTKFMNAVRKGQQYVEDHPQEALAILLSHEDSTAPLDREIEEESLKILLPLMDAGSQPFGYQDSDSWSKVAEWLSGNGLLSKESVSGEAFENL